ALHAGRLGGADGGEEHVAAAQQLFRAAGVQDGAGVDLRGDRKGDAGGDVGLDDAGDDVDRGALGGDDQVHAGGAGHLRQAADRVLHLAGGSHHQVGQLVDDDDNLRHRLQAVFLGGAVKAGHVAHAVILKELVAVQHLV